MAEERVAFDRRKGACTKPKKTPYRAARDDVTHVCMLQAVRHAAQGLGGDVRRVAAKALGAEANLVGRRGGSGGGALCHGPPVGSQSACAATRCGPCGSWRPCARGHTRLVLQRAPRNCARRLGVTAAAAPSARVEYTQMLPGTHLLDRCARRQQRRQHLLGAVSVQEVARAKEVVLLVAPRARQVARQGTGGSVP
jgi:hypothetical protein